ncbi:hypothetical protein [Helicobacter sp. 'CLO3_human']|uniref:hypothetical protein n=1 Tax=Helicobacter sp. 'CLO3_human' TaxID=2020249 RepID=UPI001F1CE8EA|nr:hypothetical protein [Helicobacter sp. 'CLO3_human']
MSFIILPHLAPMESMVCLARERENPESAKSRFCPKATPESTFVKLYSSGL